MKNTTEKARPAAQRLGELVVGFQELVFEVGGIELHQQVAFLDVGSVLRDPADVHHAAAVERHRDLGGRFR